MRRNFVTTMAAGALVALATASPGQTYFIEAMTGDPVPGGAPGEVVDTARSGLPGAEPPRLGNGEILYRLSTAVPSGDGRFRFRFGPIGATQSIFQSGTLPLPPGVTMDLVNAHTRIAPDGHVVALGGLNGAGVSPDADEAFLSLAPSGAMSLFRKGDQWPGEASGTTLGGTSGFLQSYRVAHVGYRVAPGGAASVSARFGSFVPPRTSGVGIALVIPGGVSTIAARGYGGPGSPGTPVDGGTIHEVDELPPSVNTRGEQAFVYWYDSPTGLRGAIGVARHGAIQTILDGETPIPARPGLVGRVLPQTQVGWNDAGQAAIIGLVRQGAFPDRTGCFLIGGGEITLLALAGDVLPGRPGEVIPSSMPRGHAPRLAGDGSVAFDTGAGVWFGRAGADPRMLFCADSPARPSELPDLRLITSSLSINAGGQVVAAMSRQGRTDAAALVAFDPALGEVLLAAVGRPLELGQGIVRQVQSITFTGAGDGVRSGAGQDGAPIGIDASGRIAFGVTFTTGETAVVVATLPAPATIAAIPLGLLAACSRRRGTDTLGL